MKIRERKEKIKIHERKLRKLGKTSKEKGKVAKNSNL